MDVDALENLEWPDCAALHHTMAKAGLMSTHVARPSKRTSDATLVDQQRGSRKIDAIGWRDSVDGWAPRQRRMCLDLGGPMRGQRAQLGVPDRATSLDVTWTV